MYMTNHGWVPEFHKIVKTNADRIRAMTDEELAEWVSSIADCICIANQLNWHNCGADEETCAKAWLDWLGQEVADDTAL